MREIKAVTGQSNFDILLNIYGNFDYFIKLLSDNSINSNQVTSSYNFDPNLKRINSNFTGIDYSTKYQNLLTPGDDFVLCEDNGGVLCEDYGNVLLES